MGFLSGIGKAIHSPDFGMRLQAALAAASGDQNAIYRMREMQRQNAELALRQQAAQRAEEDSQNQIWGMKSAVGPDGQPMYDNAQIAAMNPEDRSHSMAAAINPYTLSPGQSHYGPRGAGQSAQVVTAPTMEEQQAAFYDRTSPGLGAAFARRSALGPPVPIQQGGGLAVPQADGSWGWGVAPDTGAAPQTAPGAPQQPGPSARNNPGGLRVPGSQQFQSFPTAAAGVAAQERLLGRPQYLGSPHSISDIIERYAPRRSRGGDNSDEQVNNYVSYVARRLGVDPNQPLTAADIPRVGQAMREVETGRRPGANAPVLSGQAQAGGNPSGAALRAQAARAIQQGRDPAQVRARLRQMGVSDAGL